MLGPNRSTLHGPAGSMRRKVRKEFTVDDNLLSLTMTYLVLLYVKLPSKNQFASLKINRWVYIHA